MHVCGVEYVENRLGHHGYPGARGDTGHDGVVRGELEHASALKAAGPEPALEYPAVCAPVREGDDRVVAHVACRGHRWMGERGDDDHYVQLVTTPRL